MTVVCEPIPSHMSTLKEFSRRGRVKKIAEIDTAWGRKEIYLVDLDKGVVVVSITYLCGEASGKGVSL